MDDLSNNYKQLALLADALQGLTPCRAMTYVMPMRPLHGGPAIPVLCVALEDMGDHRPGLIPLAALLPTDEKMFEDPTPEETQVAVEASMEGAGRCLCGRCNDRFPRDTDTD